MNYLLAFVVGGAICAVIQVFMDNTKLQPGRIMVGVVILGALISALGWYDELRAFAGAGVGVPLLGFGDTLYQGVKEAIDEEGVLGLFVGGFRAGAVGISAALVFGYLASLLFSPRMKKI